MLPEEFIQRLKSQKYIDAEALLKALEEPSPVSIRLNPSKWGKKPLDSEPVPWCNNGYYLGIRPSYTLDPLFHSGCYYPQEASSMILEQFISQTTDSFENIRVLDLCGAPGGKSTHLSDLIGQNNLLVANETIRSRATILAETITKWGTGNTLVTQNDPAVFSRLSGYFDIIVVDAPCSGEGMFRSDTARNEWSVRNTAHCSERQRRILIDIWPALKENGIMVYSTCTFNPGENEENIKWLIENQEAEFRRIDVSDFKGITEIDFEGIYGYGFYPDKVRGEGFFISAVRKTGKQEKTPVRNQRKAEFKPAKQDLTFADEWTHFSKDRLLKWRDELFAVSCEMDDYIHLYQNLKVVKAGTKIFTVKKNDYLPSHELALSLKLKMDAFPGIEIDLPEALSYMRRGSIILHHAKGWNIVTYKGISLGFVNNIANRVNNYFPVEWRIRMNLPEPGEENIIAWDQ
ncbi:MAG: rRNA cytosine-C5-methyltransferase [Bacteroidales bacterium]|jgi:16S rRNA C967 or C1407 C5-methylase (RsmB/RsmF family)/NOL1/NOP2/fmu family ribosome biogenesis protein